MKIVKNAINKFSINKDIEGEIRKLIPEISDEEICLMKEYMPFTSASIERLWSMISSVNYVNNSNIAGAIVECGVQKGGNVMLAKKMCDQRRIMREFFLFDTFAGMSEPTDHDVKIADGLVAKTKYEQLQRNDFSDWCYSPVEEVVQNFRDKNIHDGNLRFVKGRVEETLLESGNIPEEIALLRLDTDWYESTKIEMEILFPKLSRGGVLIVDDYGSWSGCKKAVDEYIDVKNIYFHRVDWTCRLYIKN